MMTADPIQPTYKGLELSGFVVVGIAHHRAGVEVRERFSLSQAAQDALVRNLCDQGAQGAMVVQTCNRTEIFAYGLPKMMVANALVSYAEGSASELAHYGHLTEDEAAVARIFRIAAGLDAQILGDLQIIKQVKDAFEHSREMGCTGPVLHRLLQHVYRAHKRIRTETKLGKGAASVAHAAVQFILQEIGSLETTNVLLIGTGKIGKVTAKNLAGRNLRHLTLLNRNRERAERIADNLEIHAAGMEDLTAEIAAAEVVIVATGAPQPIVLPEHVLCPAVGRKILLDLSIPRNIDPSVGSLDNIFLADLDNLQAASDDAYQERLAAVPQAQDMIHHEMSSFGAWLAQHNVSPTIRALNSRFEALRQSEMERFRNKVTQEDVEKLDDFSHRLTKKIAAHAIESLRSHPDRAGELAESLRELFRLDEAEGGIETDEPAS